MKLLRGRTVDIWEFSRFFAAGLLATIANFAAVFLAHQFLSFDIALLIGMLVGMTVSLMMSKLYAFNSLSWSGARGELGRFLVVYACGSTVYWIVANCVRFLAISEGIGHRYAEIFAVLAAGGGMMVTNYLGHRFYTFKTHKNQSPIKTSPSDA